MTSSHLEAGRLGGGVGVGVFSEAEAAAFLARRTGQPGDPAAEEVARELGCLPLALAQAAAVIASQHLDYGSYLDRLRAEPALESLAPAPAEPYPLGTAQAIALALDTTASADPAGVRHRLASMIALLSPAGVTRTLLHAAGQAGLLSAGPDRAARSPGQVDAALAELASASLLTFSTDGTAVSMHRLTSRVARHLLDRTGGLTLLGAALAGLLETAAESLGEAWRSRPAARDVVTQVIALYAHLADGPGDDPGLIRHLLGLRAWAVRCLNDLGDSHALAIEYGVAQVADSEQILGDMHPETLAARNSLAEAYLVAGRLREGIPLCQRALATTEAALGGAHPRTRVARNNLAEAYRTAGRPDAAIPLHQRNLAAIAQTFGDAHPEALTCRNNLGLAYHDAGRLNEAITLFERNLAARAQLLDDAHPEMQTARNNLGRAYRAAGRHEEAIVLHERALADMRQSLGETHPSTLGSRNNLAMAYHAAGRLADAIAMQESALARSEQALGSTHLVTLTIRGNLAAAYQDAGRPADAERLRGSPEPS